MLVCCVTEQVRCFPRAIESRSCFPQDKTEFCYLHIRSAKQKTAALIMFYFCRIQMFCWKKILLSTVVVFLSQINFAQSCDSSFYSKRLIKLKKSIKGKVLVCDKDFQMKYISSLRQLYLADSNRAYRMDSLDFESYREKLGELRGYQLIIPSRALSKAAKKHIANKELMTALDTAFVKGDSIFLSRDMEDVFRRSIYEALEKGQAVYYNKKTKNAQTRISSWKVSVSSKEKKSCNCDCDGIAIAYFLPGEKNDKEARGKMLLFVWLIRAK